MSGEGRAAGRHVLLTGAGGYLGRRVAARLKRCGARVTDLRALSPGCDLLHPEARAEALGSSTADTLIHLAWVTAHGAFWSAPGNLAWRDASADLFERFAAGGGRRILGTGSVAEYDWSTGAARLAEDAPLRPGTLYGRAKAETAEGLMDLAARAGISAAWARIFFSFGTGEPPGRLVPAMIAALRAREPFGCGPAGTVRDLVDADWLGARIADLALADPTGPVNVARGTGTTFAELGDAVASAVGGADCLAFGARSLGPGEPERLVADTTRLEAALDPPRPAPLRAAIAAYAASLPPEPAAE